MVKIYQISPEQSGFYRDNGGSIASLCSAISERWNLEKSQKLDLKATQEEIEIDINAANSSPVSQPLQVAQKIEIEEVMPFYASDEKIIEIINRILEILRDPKEVLDLLQDLEEELKEKLKEEKVEISDNYPEYLITGPGFYIPGPPKEGTKLFKQNKILSEILLAHEQERESKKKENVFFLGRVNPKEAEKFIKKEGLFSEVVATSSLLLHGKEIHRLAFEVLMKAVEKEEVFTLPDNQGKLTQEQLRKMLMKVKVKYPKGGKTTTALAWDFLIDGFDDWETYLDPAQDKRTALLDREKYTFSSRNPYNFQSILLCFADKKLPILSTCLRNSTYKQGFKFVARLIEADKKDDLKDVPYNFIYKYLMIAMLTGENENLVFNNFVFNLSTLEEDEKYEQYSEEHGAYIVKRFKKDNNIQEKNDGWNVKDEDCEPVEVPNTSVLFTSDKKDCSIEQYVNFNRQQLKERAQRLKKEQIREL